MSCGKDFNTGSCVCDVLREIASVQDDIVEDCCESGCDQSIKDLLGTSDNRNGLDTVPVLLYSKNGKPFKGFGAHPRRINRKHGSFYFRVKKVKKNCCAVLELLVDRTELGTSTNPGDPVSQVTSNLRGTGICITVDLKCFCHVTCLPAVNAL